MAIGSVINVLLAQFAPAPKWAEFIATEFLGGATGRKDAARSFGSIVLTAIAPPNLSK